MDGGTWWAAVHGVTGGQTRLSDFTFTFHFHALKKEMATLSSVLAWRIPGMVEPGGLTSMGSHRVRHDWSDLAAAAIQGISNSNIGKGCCSKTYICLFLFLCWEYLSFFFKSVTFTSRNIIIIAASTFGLSGSWNSCWLSFSVKN